MSIITQLPTPKMIVDQLHKYTNGKNKIHQQWKPSRYSTLEGPIREPWNTWKEPREVTYFDSKWYFQELSCRSPFQNWHQYSVTYSYGWHYMWLNKKADQGAVRRCNNWVSSHLWIWVSLRFHTDVRQHLGVLLNQRNRPSLGEQDLVVEKLGRVLPYITLPYWWLRAEALR